MYGQGPGMPPPQAGFPPQTGFAPQPGFPPQGGFGGFPIPGFMYPQCPMLSPTECEEAAKKLHDAMKGIGTNENKLIKILGGYPPIHMNQIVKAYEAKYNERLYERVKSETSGNFGKLCCALCTPLAEYDAQCLHDAMEGIGTDESCLIEILVGRTNSDIKALCAAYRKLYAKDLIDDIKEDTSGTTRDFFKILLKGDRDESNSQRNVQSDAEDLYKAGEGRLGTDEKTFMSILCRLPDYHLRQVFDYYESKYEHSVEKAVKKEFSGDVEKNLLKLVTSIRNRAEYIADLFEKSMKGIGTDDKRLIRLAVRHRAPYVIGPIKQAYKAKYGKSLAKRIKGDTSGDYCKLLLACIHEE